MKSVFFVFLFFHTSCLVSAQILDWQRSNEWRLYAIKGNNGLNLRRDSLVNYKFVNMSDDTVHKFLQELIEWPKGKTFAWMGAYYASCEFNGELHKVNISTHAGYFFDEQVGKYFQIAPDKIDDWLQWISSIKKRTLNN